MFCSLCWSVGKRLRPSFGAVKRPQELPARRTSIFGSDTSAKTLDQIIGQTWNKYETNSPKSLNPAYGSTIWRCSAARRNPWWMSPELTSCKSCKVSLRECCKNTNQSKPLPTQAYLAVEKNICNSGWMVVSHTRTSDSCSMNVVLAYAGSLRASYILRSPTFKRYLSSLGEYRHTGYHALSHKVQMRLHRKHAKLHTPQVFN